MTELFEWLKNIVLFAATFISLHALLFMLLISIVYLVGYIYDCIFGNSLLKLGHFIFKKCPKVKNILLAEKLWEKIQPKELYVRYETPLFSYWLSYTAISLLTLILRDETDRSLLIASVLYLLFYFIGMCRRCGNNEQYYEKILNNNIEFLKLSFLPLGFLITGMGFVFTATGIHIQEIPFDIITVENLYSSYLNDNADIYLWSKYMKMMVSGGVIILLFYVISLPLQVLSYFFISAIIYFRKYKAGYSTLFKKCFWLILHSFMK